MGEEEEEDDGYPSGYPKHPEKRIPKLALASAKKVCTVNSERYRPRRLDGPVRCTVAAADLTVPCRLVNGSTL